jgi:Tfp pilus assembly protein PilN
MIKVNLLRDATNVGIKKEGTFNTKISDGTRIESGMNNKDLAMKIGALAVPVLISMAALHFVENSKKGDLEILKAQTAKKGNEVKALATEIEAVGNFKKEKERLQVQIDTIKTLSRERLRNVKALEALQSLMPEKTWLSSLKITDNKVEFEGYAADDKDVADLMAALEENIYFSNVRLIKTSEQENKNGVVKQFMVESSMEGM